MRSARLSHMIFLFGRSVDAGTALPRGRLIIILVVSCISCDTIYSVRRREMEEAIVGSDKIE